MFMASNGRMRRKNEIGKDPVGSRLVLIPDTAPSFDSRD
jgi:hypothetical protein